ncbi:hypothetical protein D3C78_1850110 [compost metagenome]
MLPLSGAEQLNSSGDQDTLPISSATSAYSRLLSPGPSKWYSFILLPWDGGMNRFHKPASRALRLSSSTTGMVFQRSPSSTSAS